VNNSTLLVGGGNASFGYKAFESFVSFDCGGAPSGDYLVAATLTLFQVNSSLEGKRTQVDHIVFEAITGDHWDSVQSPLDTPGIIISRMSISEPKTLSVITSVRTDLLAGRSRTQYRLETVSGDQFQVSTYAEFSSEGSNLPKLHLRFLVP
jgi:hypothetical protein